MSVPDARELLDLDVQEHSFPEAPEASRDTGTSAHTW